MDVAQRLRELRTRLSLSQNQLAKRSGVAQTAVSYIERGGKNPSIDTLELLCEGLGVTLAEFFTDESTGQLDVPPDLRELLAVGRALSPEQRAMLVQMGRVIEASGSATGTAHATAEGEVIKGNPRPGETKDEN